MMIVDKPYVSELLSETVATLNIPVLKAGNIRIPYEEKVKIESATSFFQQFEGNPSTRLLCNSESAFQLLNRYLPHHRFTQLVSLWKDKVSFRKVMQEIYPNFYFQAVHISELHQIDATRLPFPIILKPAAGYSSIGVYRINQAEEWTKIVTKIRQDVTVGATFYDEKVLSQNMFIIEECIAGTEYAVDAYVSSDGEPVVLNVFKRMFAHEADMSDRIYYTGKSVIQEVLKPIHEFLHTVGKMVDLRNFPLHMEFRMTEEGRFIPIEINPLRFAGVGTTELGVHAYGINVYEYFFKQLKPDWEQKLSEMDDSVYSFLCAEFSLNVNQSSIATVSHDQFKQQFAEILEYREMDYYEYPIFSVVFYRSRNLEENKKLLALDLEQYLRFKGYKAV